MLKTLLGSALILTLLSFAPLSGSIQEPAPNPVAPMGSVLMLGDMSAFETTMVTALGSSTVDHPNVIILPHASDAEDRGQADKKAFEDIGLTDVYILEDLSTEGAKDLLGLASVIWFSDGSPKKLMQELAGANLASQMSRLNDRGAIIGAAGQVAGALGIGYLEGKLRGEIMTSLAVMPNRGMGLWNGFVVPGADADNRLILGLTACLDQPNRPLLGLCPGSSVQVNGDDMSFWGTGPSIFIDARKSKKSPIDAKKPLGIRNVTLHSFTEGDTFTWFQ
ncbi:MAG: hypothetical protein KDB61_00150 [Planctomycetes bacterium]|nr:hypothetical protein [Planctomycetota bacterium]